MLRSIRHRTLAQRLSAGVIALVLSLAAVSSHSAHAQQTIDEDSEMDGRLVGYDAKVGIEKDSTTPLWFVYFFLVVVGCSALFKTAKRE